MTYKNIVKQREYQLHKIKMRRIFWFRGKLCVDCNADRLLELDHVDPSQKVTHRVWSFSQKRFDEEVAKCVVRCRSCHEKKSIDERPVKAQHGTQSKYSRGCRCVDCRAGHNKSVNEWRSKGRATRLATGSVLKTVEP